MERMTLKINYFSNELKMLKITWVIMYLTKYISNLWSRALTLNRGGVVFKSQLGWKFSKVVNGYLPKYILFFLLIMLWCYRETIWVRIRPSHTWEHSHWVDMQVLFRIPQYCPGTTEAYLSQSNASRTPLTFPLYCVWWDLRVSGSAEKAHEG